MRRRRGQRSAWPYGSWRQRTPTLEYRSSAGETSKNPVYVEVFGDTIGQRLMRLNKVEWRRGEPLRMQVILARMSLDEIVKYITVELKLNAKNEAHVQDRQGHGQRGHREDRHHGAIQEDTANSAEDGSWKWPRPLDRVPGGSRGGPFLRVCGAQREGPWAGSVQMEPGWTQEGQRAKEDRESTALVLVVQVSARRVLGPLWQGKQPCT